MDLPLSKGSYIFLKKYTSAVGHGKACMVAFFQLSRLPVTQNMTLAESPPSQNQSQDLMLSPEPVILCFILYIFFIRLIAHVDPHRLGKFCGR